MKAPRDRLYNGIVEHVQDVRLNGLNGHREKRLSNTLNLGFRGRDAASLLELATANFDSVPLVVITGQVSRNMIGNDAFQEADIVGISRSVTRHNYLVTP